MGRIANSTSPNHYMKFEHNKNGHLRIGLTKDGKCKRYGVHVLVALHFVNNPDPANLKCVRHLNRDRHDNRAQNLQWGTLSEVHLLDTNKENIGATPKAIVVFKNGKRVHTYSDIVAAAEGLKLKEYKLRIFINYKVKHNGHTYKYKA